MLWWLRTLFRRNPVAEFAARRGELLDRWFRAAAGSGKPKGLTWAGYDPLGDPLVRGAVAVVPVQVRFEPVPGGPLEDVPQARDPRPVVAVFTYRRGRWTTDGRAVFNLSAEQVLQQIKGG